MSHWAAWMKFAPPPRCSVPLEFRVAPTWIRLAVMVLVGPSINVPLAVPPVDAPTRKFCVLDMNDDTPDRSATAVDDPTTPRPTPTVANGLLMLSDPLRMVVVVLALWSRLKLKLPATL